MAWMKALFLSRPGLLYLPSSAVLAEMRDHWGSGTNRNNIESVKKKVLKEIKATENARELRAATEPAKQGLDDAPAEIAKGIEALCKVLGKNAVQEILIRENENGWEVRILHLATKESKFTIA